MNTKNGDSAANYKIEKMRVEPGKRQKSNFDAQIMLLLELF